MFDIHKASLYKKNSQRQLDLYLDGVCSYCLKRQSKPKLYATNSKYYAVWSRCDIDMPDKTTYKALSIKEIFLLQIC